MALQKRIVGRLPLFFGEYNASTTYKSMNRVTYYGSEFQLGLGPNYEYIIRKGLPPFNGEPVETVRPDGSKHWTYTVNEPWIIVSDLTDSYMATKTMDTMKLRINNLERNTLVLTLTATPNKVFYKDRAESITLKAALGDLNPNPLDITLNGTKINTGNNKTATYSNPLTSNETVFAANATYYDSIFTKSVTLQSRYPVYTIFAAQNADLSNMVSSMTRESARTSAAGTYNFTNSAAEGGSPFLLVPYDVTKPSKFSMGGAPVAYVTSTITISGVSYTVYKLGSESGYDVGVSLSIVATV